MSFDEPPPIMQPPSLQGLPINPLTYVPSIITYGLGRITVLMARLPFHLMSLGGDMINNLISNSPDFAGWSIVLGVPLLTIMGLILSR
jgi:uncharacterized protein involved in cysteine biosynthesis